MKRRRDAAAAASAPDGSLSPRAATSNDLPGLRRLISRTECLITGSDPLLRAVGKQYIASVLEGEMSSWHTLHARFGANARARLWVLADAQGQVVGSIGAVDPAPSLPGRPAELELVRMYVDARLQRRGLGRALFRVLLSHARGLGAGSLFLTTPSVNTGGLAFYRSLGFDVERTFVVHDYKSPLEISLLRLGLGGEAEESETKAAARRGRSQRRAD